MASQIIVILVMICTSLRTNQLLFHYGIYSTPPSMIYITKSGYATNKGAMVGMTRSEVESLYGPLLEDTEWGRPAEPYGDIYHGYDTYTGYYVGEYVGYHNEVYLLYSINIRIRLY